MAWRGKGPVLTLSSGKPITLADDTGDNWIFAWKIIRSRRGQLGLTGCHFTFPDSVGNLSFIGKVLEMVTPPSKYSESPAFRSSVGFIF
jgi:hypothetical protein